MSTIFLQSNRFLCAVWKDRKICPETSQIGASFWFFSSLRFFFFTLITNNLALTYSLKYDNANKMRQCENIFVFIDLTKSIGYDLGGQCPPRPPPNSAYGSTDDHSVAFHLAERSEEEISFALQPSFVQAWHWSSSCSPADCPFLLFGLSLQPC